MFDRIANGWAVAQQSWSVLRKDKELLLFPVLSGIASLFVLAGFVLPVLFVPTLRQLAQQAVNEHAGNQHVAQAIAVVVSFSYYVISYFVIIYFNTALAACAIDRFRGGDPTLGTGLAIANQRLPQIFSWALLAATVGMILNAIQERSEWLGKIVVAIIGTAWTAATYLVVPTLAVEGLGPIDALKRSTRLVMDVWGEGLTGNFSIGLVSFLLTLPAIALIVLAVVLKLPAWAIAVAVVVAILFILAVAVVTAAVKQVFIAGLYVYATEKRAPRGFDERLVRSAFVPKG